MEDAAPPVPAPGVLDVVCRVKQDGGPPLDGRRGEACSMISYIVTVFSCVLSVVCVWSKRICENTRLLCCDLGCRLTFLHVAACSSVTRSSRRRRATRTAPSRTSRYRATHFHRLVYSRAGVSLRHAGDRDRWVLRHVCGFARDTEKHDSAARIAHGLCMFYRCRIHRDVHRRFHEEARC